MADKYIDTLKQRDKEMPLRKFNFAPGAEPIPTCPICGSLIFTTNDVKFCSHCGQRLDINNWEL